MNAAPRQGGGRNSGDEHVLKFLTYNVTTLLDKEYDTDLHGQGKTVGLVGKGFATALDALFDEEGISCVAVQEARWRSQGTTMLKHYRVYHCASDRGNYGTQLWVAKSSALRVQKAEFFGNRTVALHARIGDREVLVCACHAPHEQRPDSEKDEYFALVNDIIAAGKVKGKEIVVLGDFNAQIDGLLCGQPDAGGNMDSQHWS